MNGKLLHVEYIGVETCFKGETALAILHSTRDGYYLVQIDRLENSRAYGWHDSPRAAWRLIR